MKAQHIQGRRLLPGPRLPEATEHLQLFTSTPHNISAGRALLTDRNGFYHDAASPETGAPSRPSAIDKASIPPTS